MTLVVFPAESILFNFNITNIKPKILTADMDRFFMRTEAKYGATEFNLDSINFAVSFDYDIAMIPPIFVDKGSMELDVKDLSFNTAWRIQLNETKNFYDVIISHILF